MLSELYERVPVRDGLAAERTILAAERTFLAYVRTSFAMFIAGVSGSHLLEQPVLIGIGYALTALSVGVFFFGLLRHRRSRQEVRRMLDRLAGADPS